MRRISCIDIILFIALTSGVCASLWGAEFGVKIGSGYTELKEGKYIMDFSASRNSVFLTTVSDGQGGTTIDTSKVNITANTTSSSDLKNRLTHSGGVYGRFHLYGKADKVDDATNNTNLLVELMWQRYNAEFTFGKQNNSSFIATGAITAPMLSSIMIAEGNIQNILNDTKTSLKSKLQLDYLNIPLMLELNKTHTDKSLGNSYQSAYIHFGPAMRINLNSTESITNQLKEIQQIYYNGMDFNANPPIANPSTIEESREIKSDISTIASSFQKTTTSFVLGCGIQIKDVFQMGLGSDIFSIDLRAELGLDKVNDFGDNHFKLNGYQLLLGYKF